MNTLKLRRLLTQIHLYMAGLLAPAFLLVAISGGMDLAGFEAKVKETPIVLGDDSALDFTSASLNADVEKLLDQAGIDLEFEYIRSRGPMAMTRPTSRTFAKFEKTPDGLKATINDPNLQYSLMELHKGHGPGIFRTYQIIAAIALFFVVIGGVAVGLLARAYRLPTLISTAIGAIGFAIFAYAL